MGFNMVDLITKKRDGYKLTKEEIEFIVNGYTEGEIPDYQMSALLMAIFFQKMDEEETLQLTKAMRNSGDVVDLSAIQGIKVDKHSTGGIGDKITLVAGPLAAACGIPVAKMSGRGLGFTGGTIDKLEAIPGFRTTLEPEEFFKQVGKIGISLIGQSGHIAPADKKIYALRDVTATVANLSLISSSIMSKKLAAGSDAIILDVKCGKGAFMESEDAASELAETMCKIGNSAGKKTVAVITDMNQPLGHAVGNSIEVIEAIETLKGNGPGDVTELSIYLAGYMIYLGGKAGSLDEGKKMAKEAMESGAAVEVMRNLIKAQGGEPAVVDDYSLMPQAAYRMELKADKELLEKALGEYDSDGLYYISEIDNQQVGFCSQRTGAGREVKEAEIDPSAGVMVEKKIGDEVREGDLLAVFLGMDKSRVELALSEARDIFGISKEKPKLPKLIKKTIE